MSLKTTPLLCLRLGLPQKTFCPNTFRNSFPVYFFQVWIPFKGLFLNPILEHLRSTIMCRQPGFRCSLRLSHATRNTLINMFLVVFVTCEMPTVLYLRVAWCCSVQCSDRDLGQHRIVGLPVCIAAKLQYNAAAGLLGHRAVSAGAACCKAAAQQGLDMWCE